MNLMSLSLAPSLQVPGLRSIKIHTLDSALMRSGELTLHRAVTSEDFHPELELGDMDAVFQKDQDLWYLRREPPTRAIFGPLGEGQPSYVMEEDAARPGIAVMREASSGRILAEADSRGGEDGEALRLKLLLGALRTRYAEGPLELLLIEVSRPSTRGICLRFCTRDKDCWSPSTTCPHCIFTWTCWKRSA